MQPPKFKMAPIAGPSSIGGLPPPVGHTTLPTIPFFGSTSWRRSIFSGMAFLIAFSTAMTMLMVWSEAADQRKLAFDKNMTKDYVVNQISMDNPQLLAYIRYVHLKSTSNHEPLNAKQTLEEKYVAMLLGNKREGVYVDYLNRPSAISHTAWLESNLDWRGILIIADPRHFFQEHRKTRHPQSRVLNACLSTDEQIREVKYEDEMDEDDFDLQMTRLVLGGGMNTGLPSDHFPAIRIKCFPLYSVVLSYGVQSLDYLSLDASDASDDLVLDTIPWDIMKISIVSVRWSSHHNQTETKNFIDKMTNRGYKLVHMTDTGKWVFLYNTLLNK